MKLKKGFTLIELMVSFAIMAVISTVIIYNHQKFNDNLEITNLSYDVALALRQAQVYGVSVRDFKEGGLNTSEENRFSTPYGVHFDINSASSFIFFADANKDGKYVEGDDVIIQKTDIGRGNYISALCEENATLWHCDTGAGKVKKRDMLDVTFVRPEPDGHFYLNGVTNPQTVKVCLKSPQERIKEIIVYTTGQISIADGVCTNAEDTGDTGGGGIGTGTE